MTVAPVAHRLAFRVGRDHTLDTDIDVWYADPIGAPIRTGVTGRTLVELFVEVEAVKHFILDLPRDIPVSVEFVYELPGVPAEVLAAYRQERELLEKAAAARLREAGLSDEDSVALLESRMGRLQHSA